MGGGGGIGMTQSHDAAAKALGMTGEEVSVEAPIDLGGLFEEVILGEVLRELKTSAKSRASALSNRATTLRPASSWGAKVGPMRLAVAGCSGGESSARSTSRSSSPWMTSRQNVASSRTLSMDQPRALAAVSRASLAAGTLAPTRVKKSRSCVGRLVRCCAIKAAPPARRKP